MKAFDYHNVPGDTPEGMEGVTLRWVMGENVGAPNFVTRVIDVDPGAGTEHHQHPWEHEVFVLEGRGRVTHEGGETDIGPGMCVYVEPNEIHHFTNVGDSVLRFICIIPLPPKDNA